MEKEKKIEEKTNDNTKNIIIIVAIGIVVVLIIALLFKNFMGANTVSSKSVQDSIKDKETLIVYVENSDSKKCSKCSSVKKHLDSKKVKYELFDANKVSDSEYKALLSTLNIDSELFGYPAVIYIKDGIMYSNIINIDDNKVVDQFIKDYDLINVK